jgi:2-isopropylmalate synthase
MIQDSVKFLKWNGREVIYDAEHFFDGYKNNRDYAVQTIDAAIRGGADFVVLCDTNGGTLPFEIESILTELRQHLDAGDQSDPDHRPVKLGIHTHDDCGLAVANSITAVQAGTVMVH